MAGKVMVKVRPIRLKRAYTSDTPTSWNITDLQYLDIRLWYSFLNISSRGQQLMRIPVQISPHEPEIITDPSRMKVNSPKEARFHYCTR